LRGELADRAFNTCGLQTRKDENKSRTIGSNLMVDCGQPEERSTPTREGRRPHFLTALLLKSGFAELLATNWPGCAREESGIPPVSSSLPERVS
jgi:hypothetical protein